MQQGTHSGDASVGEPGGRPAGVAGNGPDRSQACCVCGRSGLQGVRDARGRLVCNECIDRARQMLLKRRAAVAIAEQRSRAEATLAAAEADNALVMELRGGLDPALDLLCHSCGRLLEVKGRGCLHCGYGEEGRLLARRRGPWWRLWAGAGSNAHKHGARADMMDGAGHTPEQRTLMRAGVVGAAVLLGAMFALSVVQASMRSAFVIIAAGACAACAVWVLTMGRRWSAWAVCAGIAWCAAVVVPMVSHVGAGPALGLVGAACFSIFAWKNASGPAWGAWLVAAAALGAACVRQLVA